MASVRCRSWRRIQRGWHLPRARDRRRDRRCAHGPARRRRRRRRPQTTVAVRGRIAWPLAWRWRSGTAGRRYRARHRLPRFGPRSRPRRAVFVYTGGGCACISWTVAGALTAGAIGPGVDAASIGRCRPPSRLLVFARYALPSRSPPRRTSRSWASGLPSRSTKPWTDGLGCDVVAPAPPAPDTPRSPGGKK